ncbi:MAG TPA: ATP/GTP-binding protein, partial [Actinomycetales bacterium]
LAAMLADNGLQTAPLFTIAETQTVDGLLPRSDVAPLHTWLVDLASSARARQQVVRRTLTGALDSLGGRVPALADAAQQQVDADADLRDDVTAAYADADRRLEQGLTDGSLLRGEVLARWQEFVGTGEFFRTLESAIGRFRDRVTSALTGRPAPAEPLGEALQTGLAALIRAQAEDAVERSVGRWRSRPAGAVLLDRAGTPATRLAPGFDEEIDRLVRDWQRFVFDLVRAEGQGRRTQARVMSFGVNALGVVLMLVVFASTAFIPTGLEVGVGAGSAVVGQRLLDAVFGDQAVRALAARARADLLERVDDLLDGERARILALLDEEAVDTAAPAALRSAGQAVVAARASGLVG